MQEEKIKVKKKKNNLLKKEYIQKFVLDCGLVVREFELQ